MLDEIEDDVQTETGFGTGLRAHLGYIQPEEPPAAEAESPEPAPPDPEVELEERKRELVRIEAALARRAQELAKQQATLADRERRLTAAEREADAERATLERKPVRQVLRDRVETHIGELLRTFEEALDAIGPDGRPDYRTRLLAARALLAEAYGEIDGSEQGSAPARDELAKLRDRKAQQQGL